MRQFKGLRRTPQGTAKFVLLKFRFGKNSAKFERSLIFTWARVFREDLLGPLERLFRRRFRMTTASGLAMTFDVDLQIVPYSLRNQGAAPRSAILTLVVENMHHPAVDRATSPGISFEIHI
jgi:hypothetical protein